MRRCLPPLYAFLLLVLATPTVASDGVLEINFTCAVRTGCFAGDTAGFPVTITVPGSYRLTSNLSIGLLPGGSQSGDMIDISANEVSLDLGGFRISCRDGFGTMPCGGFGRGVFATDIGGTSVRNGSIVGMAGDGIQAFDEARVARNIVTENEGKGIQISIHSIVSDNLVYSNQGDGISATLGSAVQRNLVRNNGDFGLDLSGTTAYHANVITGNVAGAVNLGQNRGDNYCSGNNVVADTCP